MKTGLSFVAVCGLAASALAGVTTNSGTISLYGNSYPITTWRIAGDAGPNSTAFGAEGMTFHNGTLYVSHDHDANRAAGRLVKYTPGASGDLSSASFIQMGNGPAGLWGPEGITVNTSSSGYGSFGSGATRIVGLETRGTDSFGIFDTSAAGSNMISPVNAVPALDDIAWSTSLDRFAGVEDGAGDTSFLRFFDKNTMGVQAASFPIINGSKGIATISQAFAQLLTGLTVTTAEAFLVASEFDQIAIYDSNGTLIGAAAALTPYLLAAAEPESIAVDEANNLIFIGDEAGTAIHVVKVPAPGALALLGLGGLAAGRRRR